MANDHSERSEESATGESSSTGQEVSKPMRAVVGRITVAAIACLVLVSCKDQSPPTVGGPSLPGTSTQPTQPGASASAATSAFEKPIKPNGPIKLQIITNGISPFWDAM